MNDGFTKMFSSLITSSIWSEDDKTRIMWITILAVTDADGFCNAALPGLSAVARMSLSDAEKCIKKLESPDEHSRSMEMEGRRIERVDGGWFVINYAKYRDKARIETRREYLRNKQRERRENHKSLSNSDDCQQVSTSVIKTSTNPSASASSSASVMETEFDQFWKAYPRKIGKLKARKAWNNAGTKPALVAILSAIEAHIQTDQWQRDKGKFIPHPSTWLNEGRWDDEAIINVKKRSIQSKQSAKDTLIAAYKRDILNCVTRAEADRFMDKVHDSLKDVVAEGWILDAWLSGQRKGEAHKVNALVLPEIRA